MRFVLAIGISNMVLWSKLKLDRKLHLHEKEPVVIFIK